MRNEAYDESSGFDCATVSLMRLISRDRVWKLSEGEYIARRAFLSGLPWYRLTLNCSVYGLVLFFIRRVSVLSGCLDIC